MLTIYKASAGSGKTFALAYEYIKLLLGIRTAGGYRLNDGGAARRPLRDRHRALLAITFTKAATAEMKDRIVRQLSMLASIGEAPGPDDTPYAAMLTAEFGCSRASLRDVARRSMTDLLNDYSHFNVSTIDSFFQTVLRTFAREIDHQGDYDLALDRLDVIRQSVSLMLDRLNMEEPAGSGRLVVWLKDQIGDRLRAGHTFNMFDRNGSVLLELSRNMDRTLDENFMAMADSMHAFMADPSKVEGFRKAVDAMVAAARSGVARAGTNIRRAMDAVALPEGTLADSYASRIATLIDSPDRADAAHLLGLASVRKYIDDPGAGFSFSRVIPAAYLRTMSEADKERLGAAIGENFAEAARLLRRAKVLEAMKKSLVNLEFISLVKDSMDAFLKESNTMLISDSGDLLQKIISDSETPFIYERIGNQIESLLIDEFQDTSRMQWRNLKPLVSNSLGQEHDNLIIGDVKQAIYRFRNSDPSLLGSSVESRDFPGRHRLRGSSAADNTNRRSSAEVVRFNNTLFANLATMLGVDGYQGVVQELDGANSLPGYVRVAVGGDYSACPPPAMLPDGAAGAPEAYAPDPFAADVNPVFDRMAADIMRQRRAGYRWKDIMILVRRNSEAADIVSYLLRKYPYMPVLSDEALLLHNSLAVRTAMSILQMAEHVRGKSDDKSPYISGEAIAEFNNRCHIKAEQGMPLAEAFMEALADIRGGQADLQVLADVRSRNPANLVVYLEDIISGLPAEFRQRDQAYLAALQDRAVAHCQGPDPSIAAFLKAYARNKGKWAIQAGDDLDSIRVMTIHTSKGLEADCVHIPLADWVLQGNDNAWLPMDAFAGIPDGCRPPMIRMKVGPDSDIADPAVMPEFSDCCARVKAAACADTLNLTYVAFTRARRELCVYSEGRNIGATLLQGMAMRPPCADSRLTDIAAAITTEAATGATVATIGAPTRPKEASAQADGAARRVSVLSAAPYCVFHRADSLAHVSIDDAFAEDSDLGNEYPADNGTDSSESLQAAARGNALHAILSAMAVEDDLDSAVDTYRRLGYCTAAEADTYRRLLRQAFAQAPAQVHRWFSPECEVFAERSIYDPTAERKTAAGTVRGITYRPDRVVRLQSGMMEVVDYKFTSEVRPAHLGQVRTYVSLVERLDPSPARACLWYPLLGKVVQA